MEALSYFGIFLLALIGTPFFLVMSLIGMVAFSFAGIDGSAIVVEIYRVASAPALLTIPLFTFAGYLMAESKSPQRLFQLADAAVGFLPGGMAIVCILISAFFTAFTGGSGVTIIALGGLIYPVLKQEGYTDQFSIGLISTCGSLGLLFPPSLPIILYGLVAKVDIEKLFLAGLVPGFFLIIILVSWSYYKSPSRGQKRVSKKFNLTKLKHAAIAARYEIPMPIFILAGIYGGIITPQEAASLTALYVLIMECFLYKDLSLTKDIPRVVKDSLGLVGAILIMLCCAMAMTNYLVDQEIPMRVLAIIKQHIHSKYAFLLFLNFGLLIVGSLMEVLGAIIVVVPLLIPMALEYQVDPIHLAIIFLTNLEIGFITPPFGINLFISSFRFKRPVTEVYRSSLPFLIIMVISLLLITYLPELFLLKR